MTSESIVLTLVEASVPINWRKDRGAIRSPSEGARLASLLQRMATSGAVRPLYVTDRKFTVTATIKEGPDGGCRSQIVLTPTAPAQDKVVVAIKLTRDATGMRGKLSVALNPTALLVRNNACVTIADPSSGNEHSFPSSAPPVNQQLFSVGFYLLEALSRWRGDDTRPIFDVATRKEIAAGNFRISRLRWSAKFESPSPVGFLRVLPLLYGHMIPHGGSYIQLAEYRGLRSDFSVHAGGDRLSAVALRKLHGRKPLYSVRFSADNVVQPRTDVNDLTVASEPAALSAINVDIDVHTDGLRQMIKYARNRRPTAIGLNKSVPVATTAIAPTSHQLTVAIGRLSQDERANRTSLARWLIPEIVNRVLRFDILT